jgi:hypothetical protein
VQQVSYGPLIMSIMLIISCYTGFFNVRRGWQSLNTGPRFYLRLIRWTGWLCISYIPHNRRTPLQAEEALGLNVLVLNIAEKLLAGRKTPINQSINQSRVTLLNHAESVCFKSAIQSERSLFLSKIKTNTSLKLHVGVSPL